ncbi:MAG: hypothetical protein AB1631_19535, partial [Acidobacteriota bacterium]
KEIEIQGNEQDDSEVVRSIRLPKKIWRLLDGDADRCDRTTNGQLKAILKAYYKVSNVELMDISRAREQISPHLRSNRSGVEEQLLKPSPEELNYIQSIIDPSIPHLGIKEEEEARSQEKSQAGEQLNIKRRASR